MTLFTCKSFQELSTYELYEIIQLRIRVFSVAQRCFYQDLDGKDFQSWHLMLRNENGIFIGYSRLLPPPVAHQDYASIGRILTAPSVRKAGYGKAIVQESLLHLQQLVGKIPVKISAQSHLRSFYQSFSFVPVGEDYLEDGIPHVDMLLE